MRSLILCLGFAREPRVHAGLRRDFPLLFLVLPLIAGQLGGTIIGLWGLIPAFTALWLIPKGVIFRGPMLAFILGILSVVANARPSPGRLPGEEQTVQIDIKEEPRRPSVGEIRFEGQVTTSPLGHSSSTSFWASCSGIELPWRNASQIRAGTVALMRAKFLPVVSGVSPFSYDSNLKRRGIDARCKVHTIKVAQLLQVGLREQMIERLRGVVTHLLGEGESSGLLLSMGLGIRDVLSVQTEQAFKATGLAHLLVVSGYQVTLLFVSTLYILQLIVRFTFPKAAWRYSPAVLGGASFLITALFIYIIGLEGSTLRAGLALLFYLLAQLFERRGGMLNSILASLAIISILWPGAAFDPGVQLTYAALLGIALGASARRAAFLQGLSVTFFATLSTAMISLLWFGSVSCIGFVLNPLLAPLLGFISCNGGFMAIFLHISAVDPAGLGLRIISKLLQVSRDVVISAAELPFASVAPEGVYATLVLVTFIGIIGARMVFKFNQYVFACGLARD